MKFRTPSGVPSDLAQLPHRAATTAMRPWDWALPPKPVDLEIISAIPSGWSSAARAERRPPLLFIPGAGGAAWVFAEHWLGAASRRGYPAHALSLRGHGGSAGHERISVTLLRDYIYDVLQAIVTLPEPPVLVGHGLGAVVVQEVLARYPARAGVLVAPVPLSGALGQNWRALWRNPLTQTSALLTGRQSPDPQTMFCGIADPLARDYLQRLSRESPAVLLELVRPRRIGPVYCPVGVAGCEFDQVVSPQEVRRTADVYGVRPMWLPGVGHQVALDSGHSVALDVILDWVDGHAPATAEVVAPPVSRA